METITYQILIIAFVILIALILCGTLLVAFHYSKKWRRIHQTNEDDQQLIRLMEEEREQKNRIIKIIKTKKYTHLN